jgi:L,D-transpeptidase ErfK/SrfK
MYPEDIAELFPLVKVGTPVTLINEPLKIARIDGEVWLEVHPPVDAEGQTHEPDLDAFSTRLEQVLGESEAAVHWDFALQALRAALGVPTIIGLELLPEPAEVPESPDPAEPPAEPVAPAAL